MARKYAAEFKENIIVRMLPPELYPRTIDAVWGGLHAPDFRLTVLLMPDPLVCERSDSLCHESASL